MITAIIPTYRRPRLLVRAVASVLSQAGPTLQVCIFDNASGDETLDVVKRIAQRDDRVAYHCHASNIGAVANFEFGLRSVRTPFFSILSDDDYLLPGFYEKAFQDLQKHTAAMYWAGMTLHVDAAGKIRDARVDRWPREGVFNPPDGLIPSLNGKAPTWTGIVFRSEILERIGLPDRETLGPSDLDFTLKAAATQQFVLSKHPSAVFTLNPSAFSATQPLSSFWPGWQKMFRNLESLETLDDATKADAMRILHGDARKMLFRRGANAIASGRHGFARDAAIALNADYAGGMRPALLRVVAWACENNSWVQRAYTRAYRIAENRIVRSRVDLESRFGHLVDRSI